MENKYIMKMFIFAFLSNLKSTNLNYVYGTQEMIGCLLSTHSCCCPDSVYYIVRSLFFASSLTTSLTGPSLLNMTQRGCSPELCL